MTLKPSARQMLLAGNLDMGSMLKGLGGIPGAGGGGGLSGGLPGGFGRKKK